MEIEMTTETTAAAILWARERMMDQAAKLGDAVCASEFQSGQHDASELIVELCEAYRAGHSANAERVAVLEAENARLREAGNALSFAAQTSGGTAGRDDALVAAIDGWAAAKGCKRCGTMPIRDTLDGDPLCQSCCDMWARGQAIEGHAS
jgi:hypothetical protein